jgi:diguanylate cyclase (GGDEF)-like protein
MDEPQGALPLEDVAQSLEAVGDAYYPDAGGGLELIVRDLARALGAEVALLAVPDEGRGHAWVRVACGVAVGPDGPPPPLEVDGFVSRALVLTRASIEPIGMLDSSFGSPVSGAPLTHAVAAPIHAVDGPAGVLCAAFAALPPAGAVKTLWLAESYARIASLCLEDHGALDGLLSAGRVDALTGCLSHAAFLHELGREVSRSERDGRQLSLAFIDLDSFRRVNDRYGHPHGSQVLASLGAVLRSGVGPEGMLGRYGGDEFVLLLPDTGEAAAVEAAERLRSIITTAVINLPHDPIDASIGVAQWQPGTDADVLLADADRALLAAKASGGGTVSAASLIAAANEWVDPVPDDVRVVDVLDVLVRFDEFGGASVQLAAWELGVDERQVVAAWQRAIREGLLEPAGTELALGEEMWRLTDAGRQASETKG